MKWKAAVVTLMVLTSGCIFAGAATQPAEDLQDDAEDAVEQHATDANLVEVWGVEPPTKVEHEDARLLIHLDEEPGDGNAPGWGFLFVGEGRSSAILTASGLGVLAEYSEDTEDWHEERTPLADWSVTSTEAASILQGNETWPEMQDDTMVVWRLTMQQIDEGEDLKPVWMAAVAPIVPDSTEAHALVDANTGEIIAVGTSEDEYHAPTQPPADVMEGGCDAESDSGQITPISELEATIEMEERGSLRIDASAFGSGQLELTVTEDGEEVYAWDKTALVGGTQFSDQLGSVDEGTYEATLSTPAGTFDGDLHLTGQWGDEACPYVQEEATAITPTVEGLLTDTASPYANLPHHAAGPSMTSMAP